MIATDVKSMCTKCKSNPVYFVSGKSQSWCLKCRRELELNRIVKNKSLGLCVSCGQRPSREHIFLCDYCNERRSIRQKAAAEAAKRRAVEYLGGVCKMCGLKETVYLSVYDFHHRDPTMKDTTMDHMSVLLRNWKKAQPELDKCDLLCSNCHRKYHEINGKPSGTNKRQIVINKVN